MTNWNAQYRPIRTVLIWKPPLHKIWPIGNLGGNSLYSRQPPFVLGANFQFSTRGCISLVCKLFTWIKSLLFHISDWEILLTALRRKRYFGQECSEEHSGGRKGSTKPFFQVSCWKTSSTPIPICPLSRTYLAHLFPYKLFLVLVPSMLSALWGHCPSWHRLQKLFMGSLSLKTVFSKLPAILPLNLQKPDSSDLQ